MRPERARHADARHPARVDATWGDVGHVVRHQALEVRVRARRRLVPRDALRIVDVRFAVAYVHARLVPVKPTRGEVLLAPVPNPPERELQIIILRRICLLHHVGKADVEVVVGPGQVCTWRHEVDRSMLRARRAANGMVDVRVVVGIVERARQRPGREAGNLLRNDPRVGARGDGVGERCGEGVEEGVDTIGGVGVLEPIWRTKLRPGEKG